MKITTSDGTYGGRSPETIVRREYGRAARIIPSADRNNPDAGMIVRTDKYGTHVLARLIRSDR